MAILKVSMLDFWGNQKCPKNIRQKLKIPRTLLLKWRLERRGLRIAALSKVEQKARALGRQSTSGDVSYSFRWGGSCIIHWLRWWIIYTHHYMHILQWRVTYFPQSYWEPLSGSWNVNVSFHIFSVVTRLEQNSYPKFGARNRFRNLLGKEVVIKTSVCTLWEKDIGTWDQTDFIGMNWYSESRDHDSILRIYNCL